MTNTETITSPVHKLREGLNRPIEEFCVVISSDEVKELQQFTEEISYDPERIKGRIKEIMLLHIAAIKYVVLSFHEEEDYLGIELLEHCDRISKTLYMFYKDINILLISKELRLIWRNYLKLQDMRGKVADTSVHRLEAGQDKMLRSLNALSSRVKLI
ncbi:MAG: hypothetical protein JHC33_04010 [Ignisphaera sp.]|nr:hypothetical protein [Ignisphaera sp.]